MSLRTSMSITKSPFEHSGISVISYTETIRETVAGLGCVQHIHSAPEYSSSFLCLYYIPIVYFLGSDSFLWCETAAGSWALSLELVALKEGGKGLRALLRTE